jgi:hypothetical protein
MRYLIALSVALIIAGCGSINGGHFVDSTKQNECGKKGSVELKMKFGDAYLQATPKVKVKREGAIVLRLFPEKNPESGINYRELEVTLVGENEKAHWLNKKVKAADTEKGRVVICAGEDLELGEYKYLIKVPSVGELDPHAIIIRD